MPSYPVCLTVHHHLTVHLPSSPVRQTIYHCPTICTTTPRYPSPSACLSLSGSLTKTMTHLTTCLSSNTIQHTQDSSQTLAVMNGEQSRRAKKFCRAFTNYNLLLCALDVSTIYPSVSRHVAQPKSGEDAHITHGMCDFGGLTINQPRLEFSYVLPRLWDPGGVRSTPNVPMMNLD